MREGGNVIREDYIESVKVMGNILFLKLGYMYKGVHFSNILYPLNILYVCNIL